MSQFKFFSKKSGSRRRSRSRSSAYRYHRHRNIIELTVIKFLEMNGIAYNITQDIKIRVKEFNIFILLSFYESQIFVLTQINFFEILIVFNYKIAASYLHSIMVWFTNAQVSNGVP